MLIRGIASFFNLLIFTFEADVTFFPVCFFTSTYDTRCSHLCSHNCVIPVEVESVLGHTLASLHEIFSQNSEIVLICSQNNPQLFLKLISYSKVQLFIRIVVNQKSESSNILTCFTNVCHACVAHPSSELIDDKPAANSLELGVKKDPQSAVKCVGRGCCDVKTFGQPKKVVSSASFSNTKCIATMSLQPVDPGILKPERAHTVTVLFILTCALVYVTLLEETPQDTTYNTKRGIVASILVFLCFGVTQAKDGPFTRPHPAYWRFWLCVTVVYELFLIFILFQNVHDGRQFMKYIDPKLGVPLPERDYGGNCLLYDPGNTTDPLHNLWDKIDGFVPAHFLGWYIKTLMIRDWWMCMIISVMFEFLEYSLEHQLPNFSECWWDHWIMDVLVCNSLGIYCGMKALAWLSMKPYQWQGLWNIPTYKGKIKRIAFQFTPYSWVKFEWKPASTVRRWLAVLGIIFMFLLAELNTFYLKFVLWMPPEHYLVLLRLVFFVNVGGVAMREIYDFMDHPKFHKKLGQQAWLVAAITVTEFLIVVKYDPNTIMLPIPFFIMQCWLIGLMVIITWTVWRFFIRSKCPGPVSDITLRYKETRRRKQEAPADRERPLGNGSTATPSGRSKLNGSSETVRQRKS